MRKPLPQPFCRHVLSFIPQKFENIFRGSIKFSYWVYYNQIKLGPKLMHVYHLKACRTLLGIESAIFSKIKFIRLQYKISSTKRRGQLAGILINTSIWKEKINAVHD